MSESLGGQLTGAQGVVKWFDPKKGYGFIVGPEGQDVFAHFTRIEGEGFRALRDGATVTYDATLSDKGWQATRIVREPEITVAVRSKDRHARSPRR